MFLICRIKETRSIRKGNKLVKGPEPGAMRHHVGCVHKRLNHGTEEKQTNRDHACKLKGMDWKKVTKLDYTSRFVQQCFTRDLHQRTSLTETRKHGLAEAGHQTQHDKGKDGSKTP